MNALDILDILSPFSPFTMPGAGVARWHLHDMATLERLAVMDVAVRTFDLSSLGLGAGPITLGLVYEDVYGNRSPVGPTSTGSTSIATITVVSDGDDFTPRLIVPVPINALPAASGMVDLSWRSVDSTHQQAIPVEWEIAAASDLGTVIATIPAARRAFADTTLGPYSDGVTVRLMIRASDGAVSGARSAWVAFAPVVVDLTAPPIPEIL